MSKFIRKSDGAEITIINIMKDGSIREDMEGFVIEYNEENAHIFAVVDAVISQIDERERYAKLQGIGAKQ